MRNVSNTVRWALTMTSCFFAGAEARGFWRAKNFSSACNLSLLQTHLSTSSKDYGNKAYIFSMVTSQRGWWSRFRRKDNCCCSWKPRRAHLNCHVVMFKSSPNGDSEAAGLPMIIMIHGFHPSLRSSIMSVSSALQRLASYRANNSRASQDVFKHGHSLLKAGVTPKNDECTPLLVDWLYVFC